jgi:REP element-mobilizing transposase RayT
MHVTVRVRRGLPSMRRRAEYAALREAFAKTCEGDAFRLLHYSVQHDHVHMIVEASDRGAVARALQGLLISIAKRLNWIWRRRGTVFGDRYHDRLLRTPPASTAAARRRSVHSPPARGSTVGAKRCASGEASVSSDRSGSAGRGCCALAGAGMD